ncbi:MAG: ABC transporter permease [Bacteroidia bacterium]|nr:ABC transporter permease [Bacteroidia bacterium]
MKFFLQRLLQGFLVIWGIVTLLFVIFYTLGDPAEYLVGDQADEATKTAIREKYGLDRPLPVQYVRYLNDLSPLGINDEGNFAVKFPNPGRSYQTNASVGEMIVSRMEGTLILAGVSIVFAAILGIFLGIIAALKYNTVWDHAILSGSVLGISAPSFFVGVLIAWLFAVKLRAFTGLNVSGHFFEENIFSPGRTIIFKNLILPAIALGIRPLAVFIQLTRSSMLEVLATDYIRTAKAKGLSPRSVLFRHALRNALNPVMTSITGWLASLLAGAFFIEYIFDWQGIGKLTIDALNTNDFPVILGCAMTIGIIFVAASILTDILYAVLDPRVRLS